MPARRSAGILLVRDAGGPAGLQVLIAHPGGPLWARKDLGAWSIPKGEYGPDEDPFDAARREFAEELGTDPPAGVDAYVALGEVQQSGGKIVTAWAVRGDLDAGAIVSNKVQIEWPPRSGRTLEIPEIDRAEWFGIPAARERLLTAQQAFLDRLPWVDNR